MTLKVNVDFGENVEEIFNIKKSRASEIIAMLLDIELIEQAEPTKYKFKKWKLLKVVFL